MSHDKWSQFYKDVYGQDFSSKDTPHGWVQWKGTSVCMDLHCKCGHHGHVDEEFFYYYECPKCKTVFAVGQTVKLIELTQEQKEYALEERSVLVKTSSLEES